MKPIMIQLACLSVATALLFGATAATAQPPYNELIVFGDSKSDNGNDFILTKGLVVPPPYWGGRFSNGPLWVEQLWERLRLAGHSTESDPRPAPSEAGGSNYAYGGAESGPGFSRESCVMVDGTKTCAVNIGLQIEYFFAGGGTLDGDELIIVQGGTNNTSAVLSAHYMGEHIATLANAGGKVFLVPNLTRLNTTPGARPEWENTLDSFVARFNTALEKELDAIEAQFDVTIFRFDWLALEDAIFSDPAAFGLTNVTDAACPGCGFGIPAPGAADTIVPNPDEYLYWDTAHYTRVVQRISGDAAADLVLAGATAHTAAASAAQLEAEVTAPSVHVASVNTAAVLTGNGKLRGGHRFYGTAEVLIVDDFGNPVSGARVTGTFASNVLRKDETVSSITGPNGLATLSTRSSGSGYTVSFTFCVDDVAASLPYDPAENVMTCDTDTFPD